MASIKCGTIDAAGSAELFVQHVFAFHGGSLICLAGKGSSTAAK